MTNKDLHPSIEQFKAFVKNNPGILEEVRSGKSTLQELFEEWYLLGEDDTRWSVFRKEDRAEASSDETKADWMTKALGTLKKMDPNQMQSYISHLSQALGAVQGVLAQFKSGTAQNQSNPAQQKPNHPFVFRKD